MRAVVEYNAADHGRRPIPLCVDLDGTLVRTDMLHEAILDVAKQQPLSLLKAFGMRNHTKAGIKYRIGELARLDVSNLPYQAQIIELITEARSNGRPIVLATAAAPQIAKAVADHLAVFDEVLCSDDNHNLSGQNKAERLVERFGERGFDYIGNHYDDLAVWRVARHVVVVSNDNQLFDIASRHGQTTYRVTHAKGGILPLIKSLRPHQWLKNLLIFLPLVAAHQFADLSLVLNAFLAAIAFSLTASSVYIANDLFDLKDDRTHKRKRNRPFASGEASIVSGVALFPALLAAAAGIALLLPPLFLLTLIAYMVFTTAYSFRLKRQVIFDVILLAGLYTMRVLAGSAATLIAPSFWLLAFSMFIFFSLALVKRYTELLGSPITSTALPGRGYMAADMGVLMSLGTSSGLVSVLILALYIASPQVVATYQEPIWLWLVLPAILYWMSRLWMKTHRGEVHDDPVLFAMRDRQSIIIVLFLAPVVTAARLGFKPWEYLREYQFLSLFN